MSRKKTADNHLALAVGLGVALAVLGFGLFTVEGMRAADLPSRLAWPLARLVFFVGVGLLAAQAVDAAGWTEKLGFLAGPLFRYANLGPYCSAAFTAAFVSGVSANAMLSGFYKEKRITRKQLFLANLMNQFPAYFLHLPMTFFIVTPLTRTAGLLYFLLTFLANVLRTGLVVIYGRFFMAPRREAGEKEAPRFYSSSSKKKTAGFWAGVKKKLPGRLMRVTAYVVPTYALVHVLTQAGVFDLLENVMARAALRAVVPVEALGVVMMSFISEFTAGFAAAGALMDAGAITVKQTVMALLMGNIIAFPVRAIRHQLPRYMGIFSPVLGLQLLLAGQGFRVASLVLVGAGYWFAG